MAKDTDQRKGYGAHGEDLAAAELERRGFALLARNYRKKTGEIDIIAIKADVVYFVEVKSKHDSAYSPPADSVTPRKRRHIADTAAIWFSENGESESGFIVAEVDLRRQSVLLIADFLL
jgi:putative endonuclease